LFTRFYMLGDRAISHDESIHTKFSWNLYAGQGFQHNPMMHGPLLFELTALTYHILGVSDFTSRVMTALAGVALVMTPLLFRRWIGRTGAFATAVLLLVSPSISYYSRYVRHDVLLMLSAVLLLWMVLEYLDTGHNRWLAWLAACFSVMFATKEASYFYTAIFGGLFFLPFAYQILTATWERKELYRVFVGLLLVAVALGGVFAVSLSGAEITEIALDDAGNSQAATVTIPVWGQLAAVAALLILAAALILVAAGIGRDAIRRHRLFDILMVLGTLTLPLGSAFLIKFAAGVDMDVVYEAVRTGDFATVPTPTVVALVGVVLATLVVSAAFGLWWDRKRWPRLALIHYGIFLVLYTTIFTWGFGAVSGLVGGLAYWLAQHGVERGSQPWYYYGLIGPLYEYLALLLSVGGGVGAMLHLFRKSPAAGEPEGFAEDCEVGRSRWALDLERLLPAFLLAWTVISWGAYTYAGEKMPWLLVHITLPSVFLSGWWVGRLADRADWSRLRTRHAWVFAAALPLTVAALVVLGGGVTQLRAALQPGIPTAGPTLTQLDPLGAALGGLVGAVAFGATLVWSGRRLGALSCLRIGTALVVVALAGLTVRTMVMVNYINADLATEFLVYAHSTPDIKVALARIEDVSWRVTGTSNEVRVAYGEDGSWPFTWYMVDLPNNYFYSASPDAEQLLDCPVVI
ncbi:MAG: TIGR03663 family protein, partial [Anaerolineae bacterium]|nr:TIGR03663 family protein [Anaerolineae bacterium]